MSDWIVITIGLNPLPCLVEANRLGEIVRAATGESPKFLVFRGSSRYEAEAVHRHLPKHSAPMGDEWNVVPLDPFNPVAIHSAASDAFRRHLTHASTVHFPYAGGTKAMSVHVLQALQDFFGNRQAPPAAIIPSYLSPMTHKLVSRHPSKAYCDVPDERTQWQLTVEHLADLANFRLQSAPPVHPDLPPLSAVVVAALLAGESDRYYHWLNSTWKPAIELGRLDGCTRTIKKWPDRAIPWHPGKTPAWNEVTRRLAQSSVFGTGDVFQPDGSGGLQIQAYERFRPHLERLYRFLDNQALEIYTYQALRAVIPEHHDVRHSVCAIDRTSSAAFELDVAAVLGYQLIAVSCTMSLDRHTCKRKGFEVIHRARQLGGDQARSILVCPLSPEQASQLENDLSDEIAAGSDRPFKVYGSSILSDAGGNALRMPATFRKYLTDLGWPPLSPLAPTSTAPQPRRTRG